jgi:hypothetical protein
MGHHGDCQERGDSGDQAGGLGKGHHGLDACDHNCDGENANGMGPTPNKKEESNASTTRPEMWNQILPGKSSVTFLDP